MAESVSVRRRGIISYATDPFEVSFTTEKIVGTRVVATMTVPIAVDAEILEALRVMQRLLETRVAEIVVA